MIEQAECEKKEFQDQVLKDQEMLRKSNEVMEGMI